MSNHQTKRNRAAWVAAFATLLMVAIAVLLVVVGDKYRRQWDWTQNQRNTLSAATVELLKQLPGPLAVAAYATPQDPELGDVRKLILEFIAPYRAVKPDLTLTFVDPREQPQRAREAGIRANGEMVVTFEGRQEHLLALNEQEFANALLRLARAREPLVMYLDGHGERKLDGIANHDLGDFGARLKAKGYKIGRLNLIIAQDVPTNVSLLVIASPQADLAAAEVEKIKRYLQRGGNLLWLIDQEPLHGLQPISEYLSLMLTPGTVVDPASSELKASPTMVVASAYGSHPITREFSLNTVFPFARQIAVNDNKEWKTAPLVDAAQRGWVETGKLEGKLTFDKNRDTAGPVTVALAMERNVEDKNQRIVVVGSGHFISNTYLGNGANLDLGINMVNWLSGDDAFIAVLPRATKDSSLTLGRPAQTTIVVGFLLALPIIFLLVGGTVWWRRRKA